MAFKAGSTAHPLDATSAATYPMKRKSPRIAARAYAVRARHGAVDAGTRSRGCMHQRPAVLCLRALVDCQHFADLAYLARGLFAASKATRQKAVARDAGFEPATFWL